MELSLSNVVNISVSQAQAGAGKYNTSNLAIFTHEAYNAGSFGVLGYKLYLGPTDVGVDFGTTSQTYKEALAIFSQAPNILAGGGYLAVIPIIPETQTVSFPTDPVSGSYKLNYGASPTALINWDDTAAEIQTKLRAVAGLEEVVVTGDMPADTVIKFTGVYGNIALLTVSDNTLANITPAAVVPVVTQTIAGEVLDAAITRTVGVIQYFGIIGARIFSQADTLAAALVVQALSKIAFFVSRMAADIDPGGMIDLLRSGGYSHSRGLYYGGATDASALGMLASYAGRALSVDFTGSNTTMTMHLKDLVSVQPDPSMDQTLLTTALAAGADTYVSLQGVAKVFCSGENSFFDQVYNLLAFVGDLQIATFNYLATSSTKVPQTEAGMDGLKSVQDKVCAQYVANQYIAPGTWNSPDTFGNQANFLANISQVGYYIFSAPIAKQSQVDREDRKAPLVQIAIKEAGAIHSSSVIIYVNA